MLIIQSKPLFFLTKQPRCFLRFHARLISLIPTIYSQQCWRKESIRQKTLEPVKTSGTRLDRVYFEYRCVRLVCVAKGIGKKTKSCEFSVSDTEQNMKAVLTLLIQSKRTQSQKPEGTKLLHTSYAQIKKERKPEPERRWRITLFGISHKLDPSLLAACKPSKSERKQKDASINSLKAHFASTQTSTTFYFFLHTMCERCFLAVWKWARPLQSCVEVQTKHTPPSPSKFPPENRLRRRYSVFYLAFEESGGFLSGVWDRSVWRETRGPGSMLAAELWATVGGRAMKEIKHDGGEEDRLERGYRAARRGK